MRLPHLSVSKLGLNVITRTEGVVTHMRQCSPLAPTPLGLNVTSIGYMGDKVTEYHVVIHSLQEPVADLSV